MASLFATRESSYKCEEEIAASDSRNGSASILLMRKFLSSRHQTREEGQETGQDINIWSNIKKKGMRHETRNGENSVRMTFPLSSTQDMIPRLLEPEPNLEQQEEVSRTPSHVFQETEDTKISAASFVVHKTLSYSNRDALQGRCSETCFSRRKK